MIDANVHIRCTRDLPKETDSPEAMGAGEHTQAIRQVLDGRERRVAENGCLSGEVQRRDDTSPERKHVVFHTAAMGIRTAVDLQYASS